MSDPGYAAQCGLCVNAKRRRTLPIGCDYLQQERDDGKLGKLADIVTVLLYLHAGTHSCPGFDSITNYPDSYLSDDL